MAAPDSNTPLTTHHENDLTLNGATSPGDLAPVPDLSLKPEVDVSSTLASVHAPLEHGAIDPLDASAQAQLPGVDIFVAEADEPDRSWLSRLRALKTIWEKEHLRRRVHDEPVPVEGIRNLDKQLDSLAALRDVCASIDQRLAHVEQANAQENGAPVDEVLHGLCSQMADRLVRIEAAVQRTEEFVADSMLREMCLSIERQLVETKLAVQRTEEAVADRTLHELCRNIDARLERAEGTLLQNGTVVAEGLQALSGRMTERFETVEETLRVTPKSVADRMVPTIERQLMQARISLQRTEEAVTDKTLHELCQTINARLERTEDRLHRSEGIVVEGLHDLSTRMTARFAEAEETIHRIERIVSSRTIEQMPSWQPSEQIDDQPAYAQEVTQPQTMKRPNRPIRLPWIAGLVMPALVLLCALAVSSLIKTDRAVPPQRTLPLATTEPTPPPPAPVVLAATDQEVIPVPSAATVMANAPRPTRATRISLPSPRSTERESEASDVKSQTPRFVGTLSITSVPSGASVSINGKPAGKTPLRLPRQRAGSLAVQIAHDGFERWSAAVLVPADQLTQVTAKLRATAR